MDSLVGFDLFENPDGPNIKPSEQKYYDFGA